MLLNQAVYATDHYAVVFFTLVGLANAIGACLLYRWQARAGRPVAGALAGLLFLAVLPVINGTIINVRSFALMGLLGAVLVRSPWQRGALLAASGLVVQYAAFGIPVLLYDGLQGSRGRRDRLRYTAVFCVSGLAVVAFAFAVVYAIWGVESLVGALRSSFLVAGDYASQNDVLNPMTTPVQWAEKLLFAGERLPHLIVPAVALICAGLGGWTELDRDERLAAFLAGSFVLALFVKSLLYYWTLIVPFLAVLTGSAAARGFSGGLSAERRETDPETAHTSGQSHEAGPGPSTAAAANSDGDADRPAATNEERA